MNEKYKKTEFAEGKFISDRSAGVLSEPNPLKAVRRVLRDKSRAATERRLFLSPVSFVTRQKKSAKPGKGCGTPFEIIA